MLSTFYKPGIGLNSSYLHMGILFLSFQQLCELDTIISDYYYLYFTDEETVAQRGLSNMGNVVTSQ